MFCVYSNTAAMPKKYYKGDRDIYDEIRNNGTTERAVLAGVIRNTEDEESLDELQELAVTAGAEVVVL